MIMHGMNNINNKEFCVLHLQSNTTIFLPSSTLRIKLHVSALYMGHLQVEIQLTDQLYKMCGVSVWGLEYWIKFHDP